MKVEDFVKLSWTPYEHPWSGRSEDIIEKLGLGILMSYDGIRHNQTDGEYHKLFFVYFERKRYFIDVKSNVYFKEKKKVEDILNSQMLAVVEQSCEYILEKVSQGLRRWMENG